MIFYQKLMINVVELEKKKNRTKILIKKILQFY